MICPKCSKEMFLGYIEVPYGRAFEELLWQVEGIDRVENLQFHNWAPQIQYFKIAKLGVGAFKGMRRKLDAWGCVHCKTVVITPEEE